MGLLNSITRGEAQISKSVTDANGTTIPEVRVEKSSGTRLSPFQASINAGIQKREEASKKIEDTMDPELNLPVA